MSNGERDPSGVLRATFAVVPDAGAPDRDEWAGGRRGPGHGRAVSDPDELFTLSRLHHVQLSVPRGSEEACRRFWAGVLGMTELDKPPVLAARGGCWFRGGGVEVHCGVEEPSAPARKAHPGIVVDGLSALAARLEAAGHPVVWDDAFPGFDRFYAADPFDNRLEFLAPQG